MRRRQFITLLGGAVAWPLAARAQQNDRARRIGVLMAFTESDAEIQARVTAFRQELRKLGWAEGSSLRIEERWPADNMDRVRSGREYDLWQQLLSIADGYERLAQSLEQGLRVTTVAPKSAEFNLSGISV